MQQKRVTLHFSTASGKFRGKRQIPQCGVKIFVPWNTAGPFMNVSPYTCLCRCVTSCMTSRHETPARFPSQPARWFASYSRATSKAMQSGGWCYDWTVAVVTPRRITYSPWRNDAICDMLCVLMQLNVKLNVSKSRLKVGNQCSQENASSAEYVV